MASVVKTEIDKTNQLSLFPLENRDEKPEIASIISGTTTSESNKSVFSDPAFAQNKTLPVHRWVPWIAGFSSDFVKGAIDRHLDKEGMVLDSFAGVGTTLVEALLTGKNTIGFEINPYAALACRIKLNAHLFDIGALQSHMFRFYDFCTAKVADRDYLPTSVPPQGFKTRADFYSPAVLRKVLIVQDYVHTIKEKNVQDLFRLAFAATMVRYSNYSYEPSLARRVSSGKPEIQDFPVQETIFSKIAEMVEDIQWLKNSMILKSLTRKVINDSFFNYSTYLDHASVDLVITSPPYLNNYHYNRNTRPQLYWLGFAENPKSLKDLEHANFGKYWQTVRDLAHLHLDFSLPDTDMEARLQGLRTLHAEKKTYGGNGWANYATSYFNDCYKFAHGLHAVLKPGGTALVVIGNSILQGVEIPTDQYFGQIAKLAGLDLVDIHIPRETRVGSSIIQSAVRVTKAKDSHRLYEAVVELRKK